MRIVRDETRATDDAEPTRAQLLELEAALAAERAALVAERQRAAEIEAKHDRLHEAFRQLQFELELLKRRLFHAKAERIDTGQLELEFAAKLAALDTLAGQLQSNEAPAGPAASTDDASEGGPRGSKGKPQQRRGRRDFNELDLPEERIEVPDLELDGKVERIGTEESSKVMWRRGGLCRVVFARIKYKPSVKLEEVAAKPEGSSTTGPADGDAPTDDLAAIQLVADMPAGTVADEHEGPSGIGPVTDGDGLADDLATVQPVADVPAGTVADAASPTIADATALPVSKIPMSKIVTAPMPPMLFQRSLATPSLVAHIASDKWCDGLPLHRQEDRFKRLGLPIDRGTMSRWLEHAGATVGATVVHAMHADAMLHAFCILTDATGVMVQPLRDEHKGDKPRRSLQRKSCRRGHFFVQIADGDHVFFEYAAKETSAAVGEMFRGFTGYIQADAKSVYDFLYRPPRNPRSPRPRPTRARAGATRHPAAALVGAAGLGLSESPSSRAQGAITRHRLEERGSCTGYKAFDTPGTTTYAEPIRSRPASPRLVSCGAGGRPSLDFRVASARSASRPSPRSRVT